LGKSKFMLAYNSFIVFQKDVQLEFRTRFAINAIILFAITTLTAISFSIGPAKLESTILSALLWIILFFSAMSGLSHIFVREEEQQTADTLRLVTSPLSVFLGKWLFNVALLFALEVIIVPLYFILMNTTTGNLQLFLVILISGSIGLSTVSTIIAAIISQASARGALFAVLSFPISLPIIISSIHGTRIALDGNSFSDGISDLQILISFFIVILTVSILTFEFIWKNN
jgi:heme exporter protein B